MLTSILTSEAFLSLAAAAFTSAAGWLARKLWKNYDSDRFERVFGTAVNIAYFAVNEVSRKTPTTTDDKVAKGLEYLQKSLVTSHVDVTPEIIAKAKVVFEAMHAREKAGLDPKVK